MSIKQLNNVLENDFYEFNNVYIKKYSENHPYINQKGGSFILKNSYSITFAHELVDKKDLLGFKEKLKKRIVLFKNLKDPTFIILVDRVNDDSVTKLKCNLKIYFKNLDIIFVKSKSKSQFDWRREDIDWKSIVIYN